MSNPTNPYLHVMLPARGLSYLNIWFNGSVIQLDRLKAIPALRLEDNIEGRTVGEDAIEAEFLIVALRNLRRSLRFMLKDREQWSKPIGKELDSAVGSFDKALGGVEQARDVLQHFDEYGRGTGGDKKKGEALLAISGVSRGFDGETDEHLGTSISVTVSE